MNIQNLINHDSSSTPQGHCTGISLRTYPNGYAEGSVWAESGQRKKYHGIKHEKRDQQTDGTISAAVSRTKKAIRHNIMGMSGDRLWTLTFRENITDIDEAWRIWSVFLQRLRRSGIHMQYVVVAELQERGAVHFHFAGNKFLNVNILRYHWQKSIGTYTNDKGEVKSSGAINVKPPKKGTTWQPYKLAAYLSKYINKEMVAAFGKHRYRKSRGVSKIEVDKTVLYMPRGLSFHYIEKIFKEITGLPVTSSHSSEHDHFWLCSWNTQPDYQRGFT